VLNEQLAVKRHADAQARCEAAELRAKTEAAVSAFHAQSKAEKQKLKQQQRVDCAAMKTAFLDLQRKR